MSKEAIKDIDDEIALIDASLVTCNALRDFSRSKYRAGVIDALTNRVKEIQTSYAMIDSANPLAANILARQQGQETEANSLIGFIGNNENVRKGLDERRQFLVSERQALQKTPVSGRGMFSDDFVEQLRKQMEKR